MHLPRLPTSLSTKIWSSLASISTGDTCLPSKLSVDDLLSLIASFRIALELSEESLGLLTRGKLRVVPVEPVEVKEDIDGR